MGKHYKITEYRPGDTHSVRRFICAEFDAINHRWDIHIHHEYFGDTTIHVISDPDKFIRTFADNLRRPGVYVNVTSK